MEMIKETEIKFKSLLTTKKIIQEQIQRFAEKLVLSLKISSYEKPNHEELMERLQGFLNCTRYPWVDLDIYFLIKNKSPIVYPRRTKIEVFVFGERKFILENIKEIVARIIQRKRWITKKVGISPKQEFNIKDFLIL